MTKAFHSSVLDHPLERVWSLVRDFNSYPRYIDGVTESVIEDNKRGDEAGAGVLADRPGGKAIGSMPA
jgi:ribosome-associated toxin RatA of RatAB toxin-antitoxin module